jgi:hypothetical protein
MPPVDDGLTFDIQRQAFELHHLHIRGPGVYQSPWDTMEGQINLG